MDFDFTTETITPDATTILTIGGIGALELPSGTTGQQPGSAVAGAIRWNTSVPQIEYYNGSAWLSFAGNVTAVSVVSANGFAGTSSGGNTPALTLTTTVTGILKGNGTAISAAVSGTDLKTVGGNTIIGSGDAGTIGVGYGGTGVTTLTTNGLLYGGSTVGVTAAGTTGQVLVGNTGSAPSWVALSSNAVTSFQTSLSGLTPNTASTGAVTLAGTLGATSGGTGTSTSPSAGQFLYSSGGTTYSPTTLSNQAVTSISFGTTGLTPNSATTGAVTVAGVLALANGGTNANLTAVNGGVVYSTGSAFAISAAGTSGQFLKSNGAAAPTWVAGSTILQLYAENPSSPISPSATGTNAIALGSGSSASIYGTQTWANGDFATAGDAQAIMAVLRNITTTNASVELFLDGTGATQRLVLPNNSVWTFFIKLSAKDTLTTGSYASWTFTGQIYKDTTAASTTLGGSSRTTVNKTGGYSDPTVTADTTNGSLKVTVTGITSRTIRWVAVVEISQVTN